MSEKIELTSEIDVSLIDSMGDDSSIVHAARVSIVGARAETEEDERKGLLNFLMSNRHASPFEHVVATFMIRCPIFVVREWHRHRTQSYNEMSGRYTVLQPKFYIPSVDRPLVQVGKPGAYRFEQGSMEDWQSVKNSLESSYQQSWNAYKGMLNAGIAKEVARDCLPVGIYTDFYATANLRNWLGFLSLRTSPDALYEIRQAAAKVETRLHKLVPTVMDLWDENNRQGI